MPAADAGALRTVSPDDAAWIGPVVGGWQRSYRWQFRSAPPSRDRVRALLDDPDVVQQAIVTAGPSGAAAVLQISALGLAHRAAELSVLVDPQVPALVREQLDRFVRQAFAGLGLRKLSLRALDGGLDVAGCLPAARQVGRLVEHDRRCEGTYDDLVVHELWREDVDGTAG
jgi:hypothetical protein